MNFTEAVKLAKEGKEEGYRYLYDATYQSKFYLALQYMKNEDAAQDVAQDAYIKAFARLDTLEQPEAFSSWLGRIVANTAKNELVKKNPVLFSEMENEDLDEDFENLIADEQVSSQPELSYTRQETQALVREMIDSLSDEQRICILMFHIEGDSIKDIAAALGCSENTVKSRLNYGRKNLKLKAEELQKKGYKLFGLAPVVLLALLLQKQETVMAAEGTFASAGAVSEARVFQFVRWKISDTAAKAAAGTSSGAAAAETAGGTSAGAAGTMAGGTAAGGAGTAAGAGFLSTIAGKVVVGVVIAALAGGGIGAVAAKMHYDSTQNLSAQEAAQDSGSETAHTPEATATPEPTALPEATATPEPTVTPEPTPEPEDPAADALEQYRLIISQADTYDYSENGSINIGTASGVYRYALVPMQADAQVPALLLSRENTMYMHHIRVFQYDAGSGSILQPNEILSESNTLLTGQNDGNGLREISVSMGTGATEIRRITLNGGSLSRENQWSGRMDQIPDNLSGTEITWYDISDLSALETQLAPASGSSGSQETLTPSSEPVPEFTPSGSSAGETSLPEDGGRIVFTGTLGSYSYDEVLALQGISAPDPGSSHSETFWLIVLDQPQTMELRSSDGTRSKEVSMIKVNSSGFSQYDGQHLTFSIDPSNTWWPGDISLPYDQPSTDDIHILG
jgi:RNA polymerase sigma factor (sigma-70 family)